MIRTTMYGGERGTRHIQQGFTRSRVRSDDRRFDIAVENST